MDNVENLKITVPENATEINFVLQLNKSLPQEKEIIESPIFCDNDTAIRFNEEMSCILPKMRDFNMKPNPLINTCLAYYDINFAENYVTQLIDGGFLHGYCYPYFDCGKPRTTYQPLLLCSAILSFIAVSGDTAFLRNNEIYGHIRKILTLSPENATEAVTLMYLNEKAHDILCDRLFTVQNVTSIKSLVSGSRFFSEWLSVETLEKILSLCNKAKLPPCFSYLYVLEKIYGIKLQNGCVGFYPVSGNLPSITLNFEGKKIFVSYVEGYPKKAYIGNIGYSSNIKIDSLTEENIFITVQA